MSPAATSSMSWHFSLVVSCTIESSNTTRTPPSSGSSHPMDLSQARRARLTSVSGAARAFSFLRMFRMRALLSLLTSVAVFTYPHVVEVEVVDAQPAQVAQHDAGTIDERVSALTPANQAMLTGFLDYLETLESSKPRRQVR